ncbi:MAG: type III pantothenate kinase [Gammaproteobacteria bacterium]
MMLVVDIGNTRVKWAQVSDGYFVERGEAIYPKEAVANILEEHWSSVARPRQVVICNVAGPRIAEAVASWIGRQWGCRVDFVAARPAGWGVTNAYEDFTSLGADRWAALIGAQRKFLPPLCIVDCGTAITIDGLAAGGQHLGGLILPGLDLMRRSLARRAEAIPPVSGGKLDLLARNTNDAVAAGTLYAAVTLIDRVVADMEITLQVAVSCVVCGGDAGLLAPHLARRAIVEPDLVLLGTAVMAEAPM